MTTQIISHTTRIAKKTNVHISPFKIREQIKAITPNIIPVIPANELLFLHVISLYFVYEVLKPNTAFYLSCILTIHDAPTPMAILAAFLLFPSK